MINVYVSCALTHAPDEYKQDILLFIGELQKIPGIVVLEFCPPPPGEKQSVLPAGDVYHNDIHASVKKAHFIIY